MTSTKTAADLTAGDSIVNPADGQPAHVLHVDTSRYLAGDVDIQTTAGDYSATKNFPVTVLN